MQLAHEVSHTVAVLFGGRSSEHEISLRSAVYILKNIPKPWRIIPVGIDRQGALYSLEGSYSSEDFAQCTPADLASLVKGEAPSILPRARCVESLILPLLNGVVERVGDFPARVLNLEAGVFFPVLHGSNGEDGRLQGLFEMAELAYVGCDQRASVIGIDKHLQKRLVAAAGIPVAKMVAIESEEWKNSPQKCFEKVRDQLGFPCFVKPNALGSAVGCGRARDESSLRALLTKALEYDDKALVEEPMIGTEVECAFLGTSVHPRITIAGEIATQDFYSYEVKYLTDAGSTQFVPARLEPGAMQELRTLAAQVAQCLGLNGLCRIDFWNDTQNKRFVFNEINTLPGLTSISMFPKLWSYEGVEGAFWIAELLERALMNQKERVARNYGI
jgi:D-alanine-D-alanine ligase